ncbi:AAA family ATPase [Salinactinospora qingdaonensis]|uniref:ATP-binding protein n=1 Tax=Salinactinospora qingdaonensis TaxID=702744 RepID=A0ABP7EXG7_9ACTN
MLLRFRVANFASIRDEQELSLIAADRHEDLAVRDVPGTHFQALPVVGVLGANASGKSKLIHSMFYAREVVLSSHQGWKPNAPTRREPFRLDPAMAEQSSEFAFDMVIDGVRYEYGFALDDREIVEEWLLSWPKGRPRRLFERTREDGVDFGPHLRKGYGQLSRLAREAVRPNSLLVSAGAANNHPLLTRVYDWFQQLRIAHEHDAYPRLQFTLDLLESGEMPQLRDLIRFADLGISDLRSKQREMPAEAATHFVEAIKLLHPEDAELVDPHSLTAGPEIRVAHTTTDGDVELPYDVESSGTRTWLELIGAVAFTLTHGTLLIVDELDARLHPNLAGQLVRLFQEPTTNPNGAQLVFNTHDVTLLDRRSFGRLTRDQVWLTEKSQEGVTELTALREYGVRDSRDDVLRRYLLGRFGGVPVFEEESLPDTSKIVEHAR